MLQIAQVLKSNGTDGELVMGFREIAPEDINLQEPVFIVFDGLPVPFYIESFSKRGNTKALVHLTDICSMEDVEEIIGKAVYVSKDSLPELSLEDSYPSPSVSQKSWGHYGFTGTMFWVDPAEDIIYIFLSNRVYPDRGIDALSTTGVRGKCLEAIYESIKRNK